jgi:2',3'-cyclic-nucleotide 2'-phosphodiesterase/3'-nucleotidase
LAAWPATIPAARRVTVTLLATTDLHGHVFPEDDETGRPAALGLAKIATLVARERATHPNVLLFDCGDTTQGTALAYLAARMYTRRPNPVIAGMNAAGYDAMAIGNHDFNFGLAHLAKIRREARFPLLGANVVSTGAGPGEPFEPYVIRKVAGVRVGVVGVVTPGVARGELPENYHGYEFRPIVKTVKQVAAGLRPRVDLLVVLAHSGLGHDTAPAPSGQFDDNSMWDVAEKVPGVDVILFGHTHREVPEMIINGVLLAQPKLWGQSLAEAEIEMESTGTESWRVAAKHSRLIPVTSDVAPEAGVMAAAESLQDATQKFLDRPVARISGPLDGATARLEDHPLVDWIHSAQLEAAHADVSLATMFRPGLRLPAGVLTVRNLFALYPYDNALFTIGMTGAELKDALEHAASYYPAWPPNALPDSSSAASLPLPGYEADSAAGVSYVLDLSQPMGSRVRELTIHGRPLDPAAKFRVALNHYRYYGDARFRRRTILARAPQPVFELLLDYAARVKDLPVVAPGAWRIEPPEAREALLRQALGEPQPPRASSPRRHALPRPATHALGATAVSWPELR